MPRPAFPSRRIVALTACLAMTAALVPMPAAAAHAPAVGISEIRIDQPGADNDEYFELAGAAGTLLTGLTYVVIGDGTGGSGVIENVTDLTGQSIPSSGFFVAAEGTFTLGTANLTTSLNFENSDNFTHLLVEGFTGADGDDLDTDDDGTLDITPWTHLIDLIALVEEPNPPTGTEYHYGPPTVGPDGNFVPGYVYLCGETWNIGAFDPSGGDDTPGAANACAAPPPAGDPTEVKIHQVQGSGNSSPMDGATVTVEGVVVGDFQGAAALGGFFLQEENTDADADPNTSEGIFVSDEDFGVAVAAGNVVKVTGTVDELFGLTAITAVSEVTVTSAGPGGATPVPLTFPLDDARRESVEGMAVTLVDMYVTDTFNLHTFGEVWLGSGGVIEHPTNELPPGPQADAFATANMMRSILLDDGSAQRNPRPIPYLHENGTLRLGDRAAAIAAVMSFGFDVYRLHPTAPVDFEARNLRPAAPNVGGDLTVGSFNVLNFWTTIGCGDECRGAQTEQQLAVQTDKLVAAIRGMGADVVALQEIENPPGSDASDPSDPAHEPIRTLVGALNDAEGSEVWAWVGPADHYNAYPIRNEIIYRIGAVTPVGEPNALAHPSFDAIGSSGDPFGRPPLAQTFKVDDYVFTVVVNHLKSKGSPCGEPNEEEDGQGNCNLKRIEQARALLDFVEQLQSISPDVLVVGDMNAYMEEDPIHTLESELVNLVTKYDAEPYSYNFFAMFAAPYIGRGSLDHAFGTTTMADRVTGTATWHINADEPRFLDWFDPSIVAPGPYRSSDHDPVLIGIRTAVAGSQPTPTPKPTPTPTPRALPDTSIAPTDARSFGGTLLVLVVLSIVACVPLARRRTRDARR